MWATDPTITCKIVGHGWHAGRLPGLDPRTLMIGAVEDLADVFNTVRLTVAPLRFGAGIKSKVPCEPTITRRAWKVAQRPRVSLYSDGEEPRVPVHPVKRKLAAIFDADSAGYSRLMARDEVGTLARLKACRAIIDGLIASHRGRIFSTAGDSVVADFASVVDAVQCAAAVEAAITAGSAQQLAEEPMQFRIGVHVGDVMVEGDNLLGDGVNIAARLESLAELGAICISAVVRDHISGEVFENSAGFAPTGRGRRSPSNLEIKRACRQGSVVVSPTDCRAG